MNVLCVIPARLRSTRLPRKVLREVAGRPLVVRVWEAARRAPELADVLVATDAQEVLDACRAHGVPAVLTSPDHPSGTDRVWEVAQARAADVYVNVQGDEPLVTPGHIARLVAPFAARPGTQVSTLRIRLLPEEADNPHVNKVVCGADGRALYFSKYPIPYDRDGRGAARFKHIGLYAYTRAALDAFHRLPPSPLELAERLAQLPVPAPGVPPTVARTDAPADAAGTPGHRRARAGSDRSMGPW